MIDINLTKKRKQSSGVGGIDFTKFNPKLILLSLLIYFLPEYAIEDEFQKDHAKIKAQEKKIKAEQKVISKEIKKYSSLKKEKEEYDKKAEELRRRFNEIEKILSLDTNPNKLLEYIARSLPKNYDIWFEEMDLENNKITIKGYAVSYQSIGILIEKIKKSPFFDDRFGEVAGKGKTEKKQLDGTQVTLQYFELEGPVVAYAL